MKIKSYPDFRPLEINDQEIFNQAFISSPPQISELTFTNLYAWRDIYKIEVSCLDGFIIICSRTGKQPRFFIPIGRKNVKSVIERILKDTQGIFMRVPETVKLLFENEPRFNIEEDRDNFDYLYKTEDLIRLSGEKYDGKRNLIKKFKQARKYEYIQINADNASRCLEFEQDWCKIRDCDSVEGLSNERRALIEMINNFSKFKLFGGALIVEGKISAIALAEQLTPDTMVMHILKADPNIAGLYQVINQEFLAHEAGSFTYLNMEQDLGIDGLRQAKLSYHPVEMIKKYNLSLSVI